MTRFLRHATSSILPVAVAALAIGIFIVDTLTDLEIAVAVFYVAVVLISVSTFRKRGVMLVSAACIGLTVLSYILTPTGSPHSGVVNCVISLSAIAATTYLALKIKSAEATVYDARAHLAHISRVTALGELTASIAHEVNQPLTAVVTSGNACLRWLAAQPPNLERAKQAVERIVKDASRASEVVGRVRGLAKRSSPQKDLLNINEIILETLALTRSEIEQNRVVLRTQLTDNLPLVPGDRIQLQQVILNLVINAVESMSAADESPRELLVSSAQNETKHVLLMIRDSGPGLDPAKLDHLFDAFYTTKSEGMGMGLTINRSIIEAHGGRIWATPHVPRGATFQVTLPTGRENAGSTSP